MSSKNGSDVASPRLHGGPSAEDIQDVRRALTQTYARDPQDPSICLASGWGLRISVDGRHLVVEDGFGPYRRKRRYAPRAS